MSDNLHTLPEPPLPEGWTASAVFTDEWVRVVPSWRPMREGEAADLLCVGFADGGPDDGDHYWFRLPDGRCGRSRHRLAAIAACERAYCGCYVGAVEGPAGKVRRCPPS